MRANPQRLALVQLDDGAWLPLAGVRDALLAANEVLGECAYHVTTLTSLDALEADTFTGVILSSDRLPPEREASPSAVPAQLAAIDAGNGVLGGVGTGAAWLARLGLLDGYRCTLTASFSDAVIARHPGCMFSRKVYEIDRTRITCAGGTASLDMVIAWLGHRHGERLAQQLMGWFGLDRLRTPGDRQPAATPLIPATSPKLAEAVALMQANLHEPLSTQDVAELVGLSCRQLERLFRQHLDTLPSKWYLEQRLARAQKLLQQSSQSILQVGLGCGFSSGAHFSNAYRAYYGHTPRDERSPRAAVWRAGSSIEQSATGILAKENHEP